MTVVLVVEDDPFIRDWAQTAIEDYGYDTLLAADVDEGLALLRSSQKIDVLFTDIYLKTLIHGGCELAQQAMILRPGLRVLYATGNAVSKEMASLFLEGTECLRKPYTDQALRRSLEVMVAA